MAGACLGFCAAGVLLAAGLFGNAAAAPWNRDTGDLFTINRSAYFAAEGGDAASGTNRRFEQFTAEVYAEYGLTDRVMTGGKAIYAWQQTNDAFGDDTLDGFAEAELFGQVQVRRWETGALAVIGTLSAPTKTSSNVRDGRSFERDARAGAAVLAGYDLGRSFVTARAGPEFSLGADADKLRAEATAGYRFGGKMGESGGMILAETYLTQSLGGAEPEGVDFSVWRAGPSVILPVFGQAKLQIGGIFDLAGENVDLGASGFVAIWIGTR